MTRHEEEKICDWVSFSCTCHGKLSIKNAYGYQCTRKCKHVLAEGLRTGLFEVPEDMLLGVVSKPKSFGRKKAGKALDPESSDSAEDWFSEESSHDEPSDDENGIE